MLATKWIAPLTKISEMNTFKIVILHIDSKTLIFRPPQQYFSHSKNDNLYLTEVYFGFHKLSFSTSMKRADAGLGLKLW